MAIKLGGGGGGANIPYKGSTAEVAYSPVIEGSYYKLNTSGKLIADTPVIAKTSQIDQNVLSQTNNGTTGSKDAIPFDNGAKFEGLMPNGNILYLFSRYQNNTYQSIDYVVVDSGGSQLSYVVGIPADNTYMVSPKYRLEYQGEDSSYYIFTAFTFGANYNITYGTSRGYTVKVRKSDNAITRTANSDLVYTFNSTTKNYAVRVYGGELTFARDKSIYCAVAINTVASSSSMTLELTTGTVNSAYAQSNVGTTAIASVYKSTNIQLIKYDDSSANFLLAYQTATGNSTTGYVVKKVLVAADGTHTVTDITPSGFSQGTGASQIRSDYVRFLKSEQTGKYLLSAITGYTEARYYKVSYDGSSLTLGSLQKYNTTGDYLFRGTAVNFHNGNYSNSFLYRYAEDKLYVGSRATRSEWSNYQKGAVWTLGSGNVQGTAVKTDAFDSFSTESSTTGSIISINSDGLITERISLADSYVVGLTSQVWDVSSKTQDKIAYVRQSGAVGATVNISLIEGVTSSETLPSEYWFNKEDMYYEYSNAVVNPPAFSYFKPVAYLFSTITHGTINAVVLGQDAFTVTAPAGQYLKIESYYGSSARKVGLKIDGTIFAEYTGASNTVGAISTQKTILNGNSSGGPSMSAPIVCKEFSIYRTDQNSTSSASFYISYSIGEPA